jgi:hypothetical protein
MPGPTAADAALLLLPSPPTAKTLSERAVLTEPHCGHFTLPASFIERCSCSNRASQALQEYS